MNKLKQYVVPSALAGLFSVQSFAAGWTLDMGTAGDDTIANIAIAAAVLVAIGCAAMGVRKVLGLLKG